MTDFEKRQVANGKAIAKAEIKPIEEKKDATKGQDRKR